MLYNFKVGTVTNAQRSVFLLKGYGIKSTVVRVSNPQSNEGCGYAVQLKCDRPDTVKRYLNQNGIKVYGVSAV